MTANKSSGRRPPYFVAGGLLLLVLAGLAVWLVRPPAPDLTEFEIRQYRVCSVHFGENRADLPAPQGDRLASLCNRILREGLLHKGSPPPHDFQYSGQETILFYSDANKDAEVCRVQFWALYPKRAKFTIGSTVLYCRVTDGLYAEVREEAERLGQNRQP